MHDGFFQNKAPQTALPDHCQANRLMNTEKPALA
jgi:hypothetical protein